MPQGRGPNSPTDVTVADEAEKSQPDDLAEVRIVLTSDDEIPTVALIEERLRHVRQLYALFFLLRVPVLGGTDVISIATLFLSDNEDGDLEQFVPIKLELRAAGLGSFWVEVVNVAKDIPKVLPAVSAAATASLIGVSVLFKQGRDIFWRGQTAATIDKETTTKVNQAEGATKIARADAERAKAEMDKKLVPFNAVVDSIKRIEDLEDATPDQRQLLQRFLFHEVDEVFGDNSAETIRAVAPPTQQALPPES
jgi:hypothetical protein